MKLRNPFSLLAVFALGILVGCAGLSAGSTPLEQAIAAATTSYKALDSAIVAADGAVKTKTLKGQDARTALAAFTKAKEGLDVGLTTLRNAYAAANAASAAPAAASGASK